MDKSKPDWSAAAPGSIASLIDHTILKSSATAQEVIQLCEEARRYNFFSVCVSPCHIRLAQQQLADAQVKVCSVIGFPLGIQTSSVKAYEAKVAATDGADELDMVIHLGTVKMQNWSAVQADIRGVVEAAPRQLIKVILETCYLSDDEIKTACQISQAAGAHFVKTSTGFGPHGATEHAVRLMRQTVGPDFGVKASGGIRNLESLLAMVSAGASRIGCSSGVQILQNQGSSHDY
jgi:deoxyribose-phosphate aldolase